MFGHFSSYQLLQPVVGVINNDGFTIFVECYTVVALIFEIIFHARVDDSNTFFATYVGAIV